MLKKRTAPVEMIQRRPTMSKNIIISFPGIRGTEIPLLYFGCKHFEDMGYERLFIDYHLSNKDNLKACISEAVKNTAELLKGIDFKEYDHIVFIGKSLGTVVACKMKEMFRIPASLILLTPLEDTLEFVKRDNDILLVAMGDKDNFLSSEIVRERCEQEDIKYYVESGVGHRMEVTGDLKRNLEIISNVIGRIS